MNLNVNNVSAMQCSSLKACQFVRKPSPRALIQCRSAPVTRGDKVIDPVEKSSSAFAPATIANLGPGYDWLGCAIDVSSLRNTQGICMNQF